jgi:hypothetical protein
MQFVRGNAPGLGMRGTKHSDTPCDIPRVCDTTARFTRPNTITAAAAGGWFSVILLIHLGRLDTASFDFETA